MSDSTVPSSYLDVLAATAGLAPGTKNNRYRGIRNYVAYIKGIEPSAVDLRCLDVVTLQSYLTVTEVSRYLNILKRRGKKRAELTEARHSLIMLTRLMVDHGYLDPSTLYRLHRLSLPAVEAGYRPSTYLNKSQMRHLVQVPENC